MATLPAPYAGAGVPTNFVWAQNTTLYEIAAIYLGDAMFWTAIARLNGVSDPWIYGLQKILLPIFFDANDTSGILI